MNDDIKRHDNPPPAPTPDYVPYGFSLCSICRIEECPIHGETGELSMSERESMVKRTRKDNIRACKLFTFPKSRALSFVFFLSMWACLFIDGTMGWGMTALRVVGVAVSAWLMVYTNPDVGRKRT